MLELRRHGDGPWELRAPARRVLSWLSQQMACTHEMLRTTRRPRSNAEQPTRAPTNWSVCDLRLIPVATFSVSSHGNYFPGELSNEEAIYGRADHRHSA